MTKLNLRTALLAAAMLAIPSMGLAQAAPACPAGYTATGEVHVDATGIVTAVCEADAAAEPVTVDTHGHGGISIAQLEMLMDSFGAVRISTDDLEMGSPEREAVLGAFDALWRFVPGESLPGLLLGVETVGAPVYVTGSDGSRIGMRVELVSGTYAVYRFPADDDCGVNDRPAAPNLWVRICEAN